MRVLFLGPPGSGKGTQASFFSRKYGISHLSTGEMLRKAVKDKTGSGQEILSFINQGLLIPDSVVNRIVLECISANCLAGFFLDGYPRNLSQADFLKNFLADKKIELDCAINLDVDEECLINRLTHRYLCAECGELRDLHSHEERSCRKCHSVSFKRRTDDSPETIQKRLLVYWKETAPLIGYYHAHGLLHSVDGSCSPEEVGRSIMQILDACRLKSSSFC